MRDYGSRTYAWDGDDCCWIQIGSGWSACEAERHGWPGALFVHVSSGLALTVMEHGHTESRLHDWGDPSLAFQPGGQDDVCFSMDYFLAE